MRQKKNKQKNYKKPQKQMNHVHIGDSFNFFVLSNIEYRISANLLWFNVFANRFSARSLFLSHSFYCTFFWLTEVIAITRCTIQKEISYILLFIDDINEFRCILLRLDQTSFNLFRCFFVNNFRYS